MTKSPWMNQRLDDLHVAMFENEVESTGCFVDHVWFLSKPIAHTTCVIHNVKQNKKINVRIWRSLL